MKYLVATILLSLCSWIGISQDSKIIDDPVIKQSIISLIEDELGPIPNLETNLTIESLPTNKRKVSGVNELHFVDWSHKVIIDGKSFLIFDCSGEGASLKESFVDSGKHLQLSESQIKKLKSNKNYFNDLDSAFDKCEDQLSFAEKAANGYDFNKSFSIISEIANNSDQRCQESAYETIYHIFDKHSEYLCSKRFVQVEVEIAKGNYQQALDILDSGEMIPPCQLKYKEEILALIQKVSSIKNNSVKRLENNINDLKSMGVTKCMEVLSRIY